MSGSVTALLVCHDGRRWLPLVLSRLAEQTVPPATVVAVDTGSVDGSQDLLREHLGPTGQVLDLPRGTGYPAAVRAGLAAAPGDGDDLVWLLHDDSAAAPDALEHLLAAADTHPDVALFGPKLREWPDLRRLLEVGVTITGTGRRETGLERGEYDQGQHDDQRDVLAVGTAGLLVRRRVLDRLGLDDQLPVSFTDVDLGWRAARAGARTRTVPTAVVFHAEASRTGSRDPTQSRGSRARRDRKAATWTLLTNVAGWAVPFVALRLFLGSLLRALGLLLVRAPGEAFGDLSGAVLLRPDRLFRARRARRRTSTVPSRAVRPLLAPWWTPYRHGLDELRAIGSAAVREAGAGGSPSHDASHDASHDGHDDPLPRRLLRSPGVWVVLGLAVAGLVAGRELWTAGGPVGGALLPPPDDASAWWDQYAASVHRVGGGSTVPAPPYLPPLAALGTVLLGSAEAAMTLLFVATVPLAAAGGTRFLRRLAGSSRAATWGGVMYGLLLTTTGAWGQARLGTLVAGAVLPWLAASALRFARATAAGERWRAAWGTAVWLALGAAFAPLLWVLASVVVVLLLVPGMLWRPLRRLFPAVLVPPVGSAALLVPWSAGIWSWQGVSALVLEAGTPRSDLVPGLDPVDVLAGRAGTGAAPVWITAGLAIVAALALLRTATRARVVGCWAVALLGLATVDLLAGVTVPDRIGADGQRIWLGLPLLVVQGAFVTAAVLAGSGLRASLTDRAFGWRQPVGFLAAVVAILTPVAALGWWVSTGPGEVLGSAGSHALPAYMVDAADRDPAAGTLVLRGSTDDGFTYEVGPGHTLRLGEDAVLPPVAESAALTDSVTALVTAPTAGAVDDLRRRGVAFVFAPDPVDGDLVAGLDGGSGLVPGASGGIDGRAWQVAGTATEVLPDPGPAWLRPALLVAQGLLLVVAVVLAAPSRRSR